jgi:hypothetical protein
MQRGGSSRKPFGFEGASTPFLESSITQDGAPPSGPSGRSPPEENGGGFRSISGNKPSFFGNGNSRLYGRTSSILVRDVSYHDLYQPGPSAPLLVGSWDKTRSGRLDPGHEFGRKRSGRISEAAALEGSDSMQREQRTPLIPQDTADVEFGRESLHLPKMYTPSMSEPATIGINKAEGPCMDVQDEQEDAGIVKAMVIGTINALVGVPAQTAFATIVFQDPMYEPYLGSLCKFFFFSSAVHQFTFMLLSTMPFAVGQVQDVGLIFLSSMATSIADICARASIGADVALGTSLLTMCLSTFVVGFLCLLVGKFELAQLVQYVPLPVVGGYLGYVGYFILAGGAGLAAGVEINGVASWLEMLEPEALIKLVPLAATTLTIMLVMEKIKSPLALPMMLVLIPAAFHLVLLATGYTLQQAQEDGWVSGSSFGAGWGAGCVGGTQKGRGSGH